MRPVYCASGKSSQYFPISRYIRSTSRIQIGQSCPRFSHAARYDGSSPTGPWSRYFVATPPSGRAAPLSVRQAGAADALRPQWG